MAMNRIHCRRASRRTPGRFTRGFAPGLLAVVGFVGCSSLEPVATHEPITNPAQLYMRLTLAQGAINLATAEGYNTAQLVATPRDAHDAPQACHCTQPVRPVSSTTPPKAIRYQAKGVKLWLEM